MQQAAPNIVRVQSAETILKYPDFNAAEALSRMPDISLSSDTGEGRFVQIRGIDANLDGATYGGVPLLNTNPGGTAAGGGGRAVEFDTIPHGRHRRHHRHPDRPAGPRGRGPGRLDRAVAAHGGAHRPAVPRSHPGRRLRAPARARRPLRRRDRRRRPLRLRRQGLLPRHGGQDQAPRAGFISNPDAVLVRADRLGARGPPRGRRPRGKLRATTAARPSNAVSQYDLRRYDYHRRRFGYGGEFDFQPNDDHTYYIRADIAGYTESVHKNFLLFTNMDDPTVNPAQSAAVRSTDRPSPQVDARPTSAETHRNQVYVVGGKDRFGDVVIDYHAAYSRATFDVDRSTGAKFNGPGDVADHLRQRDDAELPDLQLPGRLQRQRRRCLHALEHRQRRRRRRRPRVVVRRQRAVSGAPLRRGRRGQVRRRGAPAQQGRHRVRQQLQRAPAAVAGRALVPGDHATTTTTTATARRSTCTPSES